MKKYKWGIIGPGGIAQQFAEALAGSEKGVLHAVASRNKQRGEEFANRFGASVVYDNYQALTEDADIDFIYVATPHSHHLSAAKICLEAGKHVLLEKPLTVNAQQTEQLIQLSKKNNVVFQEAMWSRFMPCYSQIKQWLDQKEIGELQYITSQIGFAFSDRTDHRLLNPDLAGGAILDLGVYSISISQFLLGEYPESIQAMADMDTVNVDRNTMVNMRYPSGAISQFTCTIAGECSNQMSLHGTKGSIVIPSFFWNGTKALMLKDNQVVKELDFTHRINGFEYQIEGAMNCLEQGLLCASVMNHQDSLNVMQTMDEVRRQIGLKYDAKIESLV